MNKIGCELFVGGVWVIEGVCGGDGIDFDEFYVCVEDFFLFDCLICFELIFGEFVGIFEGGEVCVWVSMNGCVELGCCFVDYVSCDVVYF